MKRLAIISTHPIQYYAPVFQLMAKECDLRVFYTWGEEGAKEKFDPGFKQSISWDIPLLTGYEYEFLENISKDAGSHHFKGIENPNIIEIIKKFNPDTILIYGWAYKSHLKVLRYFSGKIPIWFRGDSNLIDEKANFKKYIRSIFLRWVYHYVDKAFYVGQANKKYYRAFGLKPEQLIFAPHAIDNQRFAIKKEEEVKQLRSNLNCTSEDILILFAGKLEAKKDPEILLAAFSELKKANIHLLFVGDGDLKEILIDKAKQLNTNRIHFMPVQNQSFMPVIYQACDLFCLPSKGPGETWGLAVNEAMAAGKAILVADHVGCSADLVKENRNGYIFKSSDLNDLNDKLALLLKDKKNLLEMGKQSLEIINNWSIAIQTATFIKALNKPNERD